MDMLESECVICAFPIEGKERLFTLTPCGHKDVCSICFLKIRAIQRNFSCPSCKTSLEKVVCSDDSKMNFTDFTIWGDDIGPDFTYDGLSQMFFPKEYYKAKVHVLWLCKCNICFTTRRDMKGLRTHCQKDHNVELCLLCIENRNSFPSEFKYYNQTQYQTHLRTGDGDGSQGHPNCEFCRKRYYDKTALFNHLQKDHFNCHICTKQGIMFKYYKSYDDLENHFRAEHFICDDPKCLEKKFVVFGNSIDMAAHDRQWHPLGVSQQQKSRMIPMHFKIRRPGDTNNGSNNSNNTNNNVGDDQTFDNNNNSNSSTNSSSSSSSSSTSSSSFDGGLGGRAQGGEWQIELAYIATDPRDPNRSTGVAAAVSDYNHTLLASSSSITSSSSSNSSNSSNGAGGLGFQHEEFPALPSGTSSGNSNLAIWVHGTQDGKKKGLSGRNHDYPTLQSTNSRSSSSSSSSSSSKNNNIHKMDKKPSSTFAPPGISTTNSADFPSLSSLDTNSFRAAVNDDISTSQAVRLHMQHQQTKSKEDKSSSSSSSQPVDITSTEYYPGLSAAINNSNGHSSSSNNTNTRSVSASATATSGTGTGIKKKSNTAMSNASGSSAAAATGWGSALTSVGMSAVVKKPPKTSGISVAKPLAVKKSVSSSSLSSSVTTAVGNNTTSGDTNISSNRSSCNNLTIFDNLKPMTRNIDNETSYVAPSKPTTTSTTATTTWNNGNNTTASSSSSSSSSTSNSSNRKIGNWVSMGGGPKYELPDYSTSAVSASLTQAEYPSLGSGSGSGSGSKIVSNKSSSSSVKSKK